MTAGSSAAAASQPFSLRPFAADAFSASIQIDGCVARRRGSLLLEYELRGNLEAVLLPGQTAAPSRKHGLWRQTCFECFVAADAGLPQYWEINLSPSGDWNVYVFADYRAGMREEPACGALPCAVRQQAELLQLAAAVPAEQLVPPEQSLRIAVCAVVQDSGGRSSFWALSHGAGPPDFHRRDSFLIRLP